MFKSIRRLMAVMLVVTMMASLCITASAGSYTWNDSDGTHTITVTATGTSTQTAAFKNATRVYHEQGTASTLPYSAGDTVTLKASYKGSTSYSTYLEKAMKNEGMYMTLTYSAPSSATIVMSASYATGYYKAAKYVNCKTGTWKIVNDVTTAAVDPAAANTNYAINYAPYSFGGSTIKKVS